MITIAQRIQFKKNRNLLISKGFKITQDLHAVRPDCEILVKGKYWIVKDVFKNTTKQNEDLGRMLRSGI